MMLLRRILGIKSPSLEFLKAAEAGLRDARNEENMPTEQFDQRELNEIKLAIFYAQQCGHGTAGHTRLMLIAKMASMLHYELADGMVRKTMPPPKPTPHTEPILGRG